MRFPSDGTNRFSKPDRVTIYDRRENIMTNDELNKRWTRTCSNLEVAGDGVDSMWQQLVERYSEPHRKYHTLDHLLAMSRTLSEFENKLVSPDAVYAAIFFHDAIYDASSTTNEEDSAEMAKRFLTEHAVASSVVDTVESLILATAAHLNETSVADADWFLDTDLAILAAEPDSYGRYVQAIRQEYASVPDDMFRTGRGRFLETILAAERIFRTNELRNRFEQRARSNLQNELDALRADDN